MSGISRHDISADSTVANQAEKILSVIPDMDYSQVSSASTQSGPLELSQTEPPNGKGVVTGPAASAPYARRDQASAGPPRAMPPKKPASRISQGSGEPSAKREAGKEKGTA